jgi:YD repeat-containing protein
MRILDLTPGLRGIWFDKDCPLTTWGAPEEGVAYDLVVFDPTHTNLGANSHMSKRYGHHTAAQIWQFLKDSARLAHKVTRAGSLMAFKWNDAGRKLRDALGQLAEFWTPLFGHQMTGRPKGNSTYWVMLLRREAA